MRRSRMFAVACGLAGAASLAAVTTASPALADEGPTGSAYALSVQTTLLREPLVKIDPLPKAAYPQGGDESVVTVGPIAGRVTAKVLNASSKLKDGTLASKASIAEVVVRDILSAKVVTSECKAGKDGLTGKSSIAELKVLGQKIDVKATTDINVLGVARVRINEQIRHGDTLTVNAVHVTVGELVHNVTSADVVLSQAKCSADGASGPEEPPTSGPNEPTEPEQPSPTSGTDQPEEPGQPTETSSSSPADGQGAVPPAADAGDLAETGVSAIVPISIGGLVLLAAGAGTIIYARRRAAAAPSSDD